MCLVLPGAAAAADKSPCPAGLICASNPSSVVAALQEAGYAAKLTKDNLGDPLIESSGGGYKFDVLFYDCEERRQCGSLQLQISFRSEGYEDPGLANKWNTTKRLGQARINDKGEFVLSYPLSTVGGLNQSNFRDVLDWWSSSLGDLKAFWADNPKPAAKVNPTA